jgi:hypothetical protein
VSRREAQALFNPNRLTFGYPSAALAVLVDIWGSRTTTPMARHKFAEGKQL